MSIPVTSREPVGKIVLGLLKDVSSMAYFEGDETTLARQLLEIVRVTLRRLADAGYE